MGTMANKYDLFYFHSCFVFLFFSTRYKLFTCISVPTVFTFHPSAPEGTLDGWSTCLALCLIFTYISWWRRVSPADLIGKRASCCQVENGAFNRWCCCFEEVLGFIDVLGKAFIFLLAPQSMVNFGLVRVHNEILILGVILRFIWQLAIFQVIYPIT